MNRSQDRNGGSSFPLIIGIGNVHRKDDGVGIAIARRLDGIPRVSVVEANGEGVALMACWEGSDNVLLVDAVRASSRPGEIHRLDAHQQTFPSDFFRYSTHAFSVAEAVEMSRVLGLLPKRLVIYGVEGADFSAGIGLTPTVERAIEDVIDRICDDYGLTLPQEKEGNHA